MTHGTLYGNALGSQKFDPDKDPPSAFNWQVTIFGVY